MLPALGLIAIAQNNISGRINAQDSEQSRDDMALILLLWLSGMWEASQADTPGFPSSSESHQWSHVDGEHAWQDEFQIPATPEFALVNHDMTLNSTSYLLY
jgi:hypothetical protein